MQSFIISQKRKYSFWRVFAMCAVFAQFLCASSLENVQIKSIKNGVEILFLVDSAFDGNITKTARQDFTALKFHNLAFNKNKLVSKSALIKNIEIFSQGGGVVLVFGVSDFELHFDLAVQKMKNKQGAIKIIATKKESIAGNILADSALNAPNSQNLAQNSQNLGSQNLAQNSQNFGSPNSSNLGSQNLTANPQSLEDSISAIKEQNNLLSPKGVDLWRYFAVIAILCALIIALFIIKKRVKSDTAPISIFRKSPISVAQNIALDAKNKILILDSADANYILFVGATNAFIIDKIPKERDSAKLLREHKIAHLIKNYEQLQKA
ncbi:hypothetical protein ACWIUD_02690 [Helicobacter sp. 23-1044]